MKEIGKGLLARLAATTVLSILMVLKAMAGLPPGLAIPKMLAAMAGASGQPIIGWIIHALIGIVVYGIAIALVRKNMPGSSIVQGLSLSVIGWLIMMIVLMPIAGAGLFAMNMRPSASVATLELHLIFGAVLGWILGRLMSVSVTPVPAHT